MNKNKGFTLIELLAVVVILGVLLSLSVVAVNKIRKTQEEKNKENIISSILTGAKRYATTNGINNNEIAVSDLLENDYVDFDQNKYIDLKGKNVMIASCDNNLKRKFTIEVGNTTYNDCGCEEQESSSSSEICTK